MRLILFIHLLLLCAPAPAQTEPALRPIDSTAWERASGKLDYSKDRVKESPPAQSRKTTGPDWTLNTESMGILFQVLAILLAVGIVGYGVYSMLKAPRNKKIARDGVEITVDNIDQYLDETDLDQFLQTALSSGNYALAVRLYYLKVVQALAARHAIEWSREKTNKDYLREMQRHRLSDAFRQLTLQYERIWYGNQHPDATLFATIEPAYRQFLQELSV